MLRRQLPIEVMECQLENPRGLGNKRELLELYSLVIHAAILDNLHGILVTVTSAALYADAECQQSLLQYFWRFP